MSLRVVTPPAAPGLVVELELLKQHVEYEEATDRDALLTAYAVAGASLLEAATQRRFLTQELEWTPACWAPVLRVPVAPVEAITSLTYVDVNGDAQTLTEGTHFVVSPSGPTVTIRPISGTCWPLTDPDAAEPLAVRFEVGQPVDEIGDNVKAAVMLLAARRFRHRGDEEAALPALAPSNLPPDVEALIASERWD